MFRHILALLALVAVPAAAQRGDAPFTVRESGQGFASLGEAVAAIGGGSGTIVVAPGRYADCAIQTEGRITYAAARAGSAVFDGGVCEGKATLVLRGQGARVEGLSFTNLRVADGNGAGIRLEHGDLDVVGALFENSESGILSGDDPSARIRIERSTFAGLGRCDRGLSCAHSIYIGDYGSLSVVRSRFERGTGGHYVKSRSGRIEVIETSFDDSAGRTTNYMIDLSAGATGTIANNSFVQGRDKENYSAFVMIAAEGVGHSSAGLTIVDNDAALAPGVDRRTAFVADASGEAIAVERNKLGPGIARFEKR